MPPLPLRRARGRVKDSVGAAPVAAAAHADAADKDAAAAAARAAGKFRVSVNARTQTGVPKAVVAEATALHATHTKESRLTTDDNQSTNKTFDKTIATKATPATEPAVRAVETKVLPARGDASVTRGGGKGAQAYAPLATEAQLRRHIRLQRQPHQPQLRHAQAASKRPKSSRR